MNRDGDGTEYRPDGDLDDLVGRCLELPGARRAAFLVEALADRPELLAPAFDLLLAALEAGEQATPRWLPPRAREPTKIEQMPAPAVSPPAGDPLGLPGFRVLETLGEGGMGTVYLAEQTAPVRRKVALKVARHRPGDDARVRLAAERQAMARLSHPHIAQIFEAGDTPDGRPYFAMEWIDGGPITEACDQHCLDLDARLALFLEACAGVQHAHQQGILHRDLKPSNVLAGEREGRLQAKIIDFGIAKALDQPLLADVATLTGGHLVGTPAYMSPEAILAGPGGAPVDTRADVFGLGLLLYELLVGPGLRARLPDENPLDFLQRLAYQEIGAPGRFWSSLAPAERERRAAQRSFDPRALARRLQGELEWIVSKALAREPDARYAAVSELAADLERYRRHEPVLAGKPSTVYRLRKLARRHRAGVAAAALLVAALSAGLVARSLEARRANREAAEARLARDEKSRMLEFVLGLFAGADPTVHAGKPQSARELLDQGVARLIAGELGESPRVRARLLLETARIHWRLGEPREALKVAEAAHGIATRSLGEGDDTTLGCLFLIGTLASEVGDYPRSERLLGEVLAAREARDGPASAAVADVLVNLGAIHEETSRYREALSLYHRALAIRLDADGSESVAVADLHSNLGIVHWRLGELEEAERRHRLALGLREKLQPAHHPAITRSMRHLGLLLFEDDRNAEAEAMLSTAVGRAAEVLGPEHPEVAHLRLSLAQVRQAEGRWSEAEAGFRHVEASYRQALGASHPWLAYPLYGLGANAAAQGRWADAEAFQLQALAIRERDDVEKLALAEVWLALGQAARRQGKFDQAEARLLQALDRYETLPNSGADHRETLAELGQLALDRQDSTRADAWLARARALASAKKGGLFATHLGSARLALVRRDLESARRHATAARAEIAGWPADHAGVLELEELSARLER